MKLSLRIAFHVDLHAI